MVYNNRKGVSPVVATALLLVVAVVAVVGFQTWFGSYQSKINADVEEQSDTGVALTVERVEAGNTTNDAVVYIKNSGKTDLAVTSIKITLDADGSLACNDSAITVTSGVAGYSVPCTADLDKEVKSQVVLVSEKGVFQFTKIVS